MSEQLRTIPYGRQSIDEEDIAAVTEVLRGDWLTQGPALGRFERRLCEVTGAPHAVATSSGTAALHLACLGLGLGPGDVGLVPAITFVATANCLRLAGAEVAFVDVDPNSGLVTPALLEARLEQLSAGGRRPRLVIPVHLAGQAADLPAIRELAREGGALVLEDAAHALGATYGEAPERHQVGACTHSDAAILSFHPVKHVATGEGGAVLTADAALATKLDELRGHGVHRDPARLTRDPEADPLAGPWYYEQDALGLNYRITDIQCALGATQLEKLERFLARRRALAAAYDEALSREPLASRLRPLRRGAAASHAYHLYVAQLRAEPSERLERLAARRKALFGYLRQRGVAAQVHYIPVPWQPYYREAAADARYPGAERYYAASLSLPLFPAMTDDDLARVVELLTRWARQP